MRDLRIALIGSHGTGKTSVVEELVRITKLPIIEEIARNYDMNTSNVDKYKHYQKQLLLEQIRTETSLILSKGNFISDRSSIDNMAYFWLKCKSNATKQEMVRYGQIAIHNSLRYSHLFYVPIEIPLPTDDGFRFEDEAFQRDIDSKINEIISKFGVGVITIRGTLDERVKTVLEAVDWS